jgi:hypothetical protein
MTITSGVDFSRIRLPPDSPTSSRRGALRRHEDGQLRRELADLPHPVRLRHVRRADDERRQVLRMTIEQIAVTVLPSPTSSPSSRPPLTSSICAARSWYSRAGFASATAGGGDGY